MPARAGSYPWSPISQSQFTSSGKARSVITDGDMEWDLSSGWHYKRQKGWRGKVSHKKGAYVTLDGQLASMPMYNIDDRMAFHSHEEPSDEQMALAERAFDINRPDAEQVIAEEGCGHIKKLEYAVTSTILRVTFEDDTICLFFKMPHAVAGTLLHLAKSKVTAGYHQHKKLANGTPAPRHVLGVMFWELVRIKGSQTGAKYPFEYEHKARGKVVSANRHVVNLSYDTARSLLMNRFKNAEALANSGFNLGPEDQVTAVLSDEEYEEYEDRLNGLNSAVKGVSTKRFSAKDNNTLADTDEWGRDTGNSSTGGVTFGALAQYREELIAEAEARIAALKKDDMYQLKYGIAEQALVSKNEARGIKDDYIGKTPNTAMNEDGERVSAMITALGDMGFPTSLIDKTTGKVKAPRSEDRVRKFADTLYGPGAYTRWKRDKLPAAYKANAVGVVWTPTKLREYTNPNIPGGVPLRYMASYKRMIQTGNWEGALGILKTAKRDIVYINNKGEQKVLKQQPIANKEDIFMEE